jgi:hypothetical protein
VTSSREHIYDLRNLENYTCVDENGKLDIFHQPAKCRILWLV